MPPSFNIDNQPFEIAQPKSIKKIKFEDNFDHRRAFSDHQPSPTILLEPDNINFSHSYKFAFETEKKTKIKIDPPSKPSKYVIKKT